MSIKEQLNRLETGYTPKSRHDSPIKEALNKLEKAGRKREDLKTKEPRKAITSKLNIGKDQGSTSGTGLIEYEKTEVTSSDGIFVFEVMVDKPLL